MLVAVLILGCITTAATKAYCPEIVSWMYGFVFLNGQPTGGATIEILDVWDGCCSISDESGFYVFVTFSNGDCTVTATKEESKVTEQVYLSPGESVEVNFNIITEEPEPEPPKEGSIPVISGLGLVVLFWALLSSAAVIIRRRQ